MIMNIQVRYSWLGIGPFKIDKIAEIGLRLKNTFDNTIIILKVTISEVGSTLLIEFQDQDFVPPYRIENMTKYDIVVNQVKSAPEDWDIIHSFKTEDYALSYPMNEKTLKISVKSHAKNNHISDIKLDSFKTNEKHFIIDKSNKVSYYISITRENEMKIIRIQEEYDFNIENHKKIEEAPQKGQELRVTIPKFGISLVNSAFCEEIAYIYFKNTKVDIENTKNYQKFKIEISAIQIDDQMALNDEDCMVLKKSSAEDSSVLNFSYCLLNNQGFENIIYFKEFWFELTPIKLVLNGNFCAELLKFGHQATSNLKLLSEESTQDIEHMMPDIVTDSKKQLERSIFFENLYIDEIVSSNPSMLFSESTSQHSLVGFLAWCLLKIQNSCCKRSWTQLSEW